MWNARNLDSIQNVRRTSRFTSRTSKYMPLFRQYCPWKRSLTTLMSMLTQTYKNLKTRKKLERQTLTMRHETPGNRFQTCLCPTSYDCVHHQTALASQCCGDAGRRLAQTSDSRHSRLSALGLTTLLRTNADLFVNNALAYILFLTRITILILIIILILLLLLLIFSCNIDDIADNMRTFLL